MTRSRGNFVGMKFVHRRSFDSSRSKGVLGQGVRWHEATMIGCLLTRAALVVGEVSKGVLVEPGAEIYPAQAHHGALYACSQCQQKRLPSRVTAKATVVRSHLRAQQPNPSHPVPESPRSQPSQLHSLKTQKRKYSHSTPEIHQKISQPITPSPQAHRRSHSPSQPPSDSPHTPSSP